MDTTRYNPYRIYGRIYRRQLAVLVIWLLALGLPTPALAKLPPVAVPQQLAPLPAVTNSDAHFGVVEAFRDAPLARSLGVKWERVNFFWNSIQPTGPKDWLPNGDISDTQINAELAAGVTLVGVIGNPPAWATNNGSLPQHLFTDWTDPRNYLGQFAYRLASAYKGRVDHWIFWNEEDITYPSAGATWGGTIVDYNRALKDVYLAIHTANPKAIISYGGMTYWFDAIRYRELWYHNSIKLMLQDDPQARQYGFYHDAMDIHLYYSPLDIWKVTLIYKQIMQEFGFTKPVWINEANAPPWDDSVAPLADDGRRPTQQGQGDYIIQAYALALAAGVEHLSIYKMVDDNVHGAPNDLYGLVRYDGTIRPAFVAYQVAAHYLSNAGTPTFTLRHGVANVEFNLGSARISVFWNMSSQQLDAHIPAIGTSAVLITKAGLGRPLAVPVTPGNSGYTIPMPLGDSDRAIGGGTFILIQQGIGDPIQVSPSSLYYPITGHSINNDIYRYFTYYGGKPTFGYPLGEEVGTSVKGAVVQQFQLGLLEFHGEDSANPYTIARNLRIGANVGTLSGRAFFDDNINGSPDSGEAPVAGAIFTVLQPALGGDSRTTVVKTLSSPTGTFSTTLPAGTYQVQVSALHPGAVPAGYSPIYQGSAFVTVQGNQTTSTTLALVTQNAFVDAKIENLTLHGPDKQPVTPANARTADLSIDLFLRGTLKPIPLGPLPVVRVWEVVNTHPAQLVGIAQPQTQTLYITTFHTWNLSGIDVSAANNPTNKIYFYVTVDNIRTHSNVWALAQDVRTSFPVPDLPTTTGPLQQADTKVELVYPHDDTGAGVDATRATKVNLTAELFQHGTSQGPTPDFNGVVQLYGSLNYGPVQFLGVMQKQVLARNGVTFPVWFRNDIPVSSARKSADKYYFYVTVRGLATDPMIWAYGSTPATVASSPDVPDVPKPPMPTPTPGPIPPAKPAPPGPTPPAKPSPVPVPTPPAPKH